jgi:DNA gyrase subunit A
MEVGLVRSINIDQEMQQAYLDYAMSVIVSRALPDARDGLKPVHRRILYAMYDMGMRPDTPYKKSARIVGEVLGKYHPHGDMAVYDAMARMAQPFSLRTLLVDGQGNFGSVDGDPPAAMRYTEARLASPAMNMLADIQKNTVDFSDNFDGTLTEPDVLPAALPNLLINGATGIAVGMSTSIPPHNLGEVVDALVLMLQRWDQMDDINVEDLMKFIQGPDFPTGGLIVSREDQEGLSSAYASGRGKVTVQARAHVEEMSRGRNRIIVTELPYMTNKATLIERIAELVRDERLDGVADLRDESDRQGLRIVIELNKTAVPETVLQDLLKSTSMRTTFGIIMLALVEGEPRMLSLKQALRVYLDHRLVVVRRRSEYDLNRARQRAHILEGLRIALKFLDEVIAMIRKAPDAETARDRLMKHFKLTEIQASAILDLPLRRLAALERKKIEEEYKGLQALIKSLETLLRSPKQMREVIAEELHAVKEAFADRRRTQIIPHNGGQKAGVSFFGGDLSSEKQIWISATSEGLISRSIEDQMPPSSGSAAPRWVLRVSSRDTLFLVSEKGEAAGLPVHSLPETSDMNSGVPLHKVSAFTEQDRLAAMFTLPPKDERPEGWFVLSGTGRGNIKKTFFSDLPGATAKTFTLMKVNGDDRFGWARLTDGKSEILLGTAEGMAIRFSEEEVRPMGLGAAGVGGIKLQGRDEVVGLELISSEGEALFITSNGKAKRVSLDQFPKQGRYGQGVAAWKLPRPSQLIGFTVLSSKSSPNRLTLHLEKLAPKTLLYKDVPLQTRAASGKTILDLKAGDQVTGITTAYDLARLVEIAEAPAAVKKRAPRKKVAAAQPVLVSVDTKSDNGKKTKATIKKAALAPKAAGIEPKSKAVSEKNTLSPADSPKKTPVRRKIVAAVPETIDTSPTNTEKTFIKKIGKEQQEKVVKKTKKSSPIKAPAVPDVKADKPPAAKKPAAKAVEKTAAAKKTSSKASEKPAEAKKPSTKTSEKPPTANKSAAKSPSKASQKKEEPPEVVDSTIPSKPKGSKTKKS